MKKVVHEAVGYAGASGCALVVDVAVLWILVHFFSWWYLEAACLAFAAGVIVSYTLAVKWVFKQRRLDDRRAEFMGFAALGTLGLGVNAAVMYIAVKYLGLYYLIAKVAAAGITFLCNFVSRRQLLFVPKPAG